jgi:hypothetical protein
MKEEKSTLNTLPELDSTESQLPLHFAGIHELGHLRFQQNV